MNETDEIEDDQDDGVSREKTTDSRPVIWTCSTRNGDARWLIV